MFNIPQRLKRLTKRSLQLIYGPGEPELNKDKAVEFGLFDPDWYLSFHSDLRSADVDPWVHYLNHGFFEGRDPSPYLAHKTVKMMFEELPVDPHPILCVLAATGGLFRPRWYVETYPDVAQSGMDSWSHYYDFGVKELRDPGPDFSTFDYLQDYPDVREAQLNPLLHYSSDGHIEGRNVYRSLVETLEQADLSRIEKRLAGTGLVDPEWYLKTYADVRQAEANPLHHYLNHGCQEGRNPNANFSTLFYSDQINLGERGRELALLHYEVRGRYLGLRSSSQALKLVSAWPSGELPKHLEAQNPGPVAVMLHMFYTDLGPTFADALSAIYCPFDLLISTDSQDKVADIEAAFVHMPNLAKLDIRVVENRGRDIAPLVVTFGAELLNYDVALHLHSKKSKYGDALDGWLDYSLEQLLHSPLYVEAIFRRFAEDTETGVLCGMPFPPIVKHMHWAGCRPLALEALEKMGLPDAELSATDLDFPAGSMFWFRPKALAPLFNAGFAFEDFPEEEGQMNDTLAHAIERLFFYIPKCTGHTHEIIRPAVAGEFFAPRLVEPTQQPMDLPNFRRKKPDVSIIIPTYNQWEYTNACIRSIIEHTDPVATSYEVIVADDGSSDETLNVEAIFPGVRLIKTETNLGFLGNCNNAAGHALGHNLLFLNNDTQVQPNWLRPLVELMASDPDVAIAGSKLIYPDATLQEFGGVIWRNAGGLNYGRDQDPSLAEFNYIKQTDYVSGAALLVRHSWWKKKGGFDTRFTPAYYEDTDLCFEARNDGYKVMVHPRSLVIHFEGKSHGTDETSGIKKHQVINAKTFAEKWTDTLSTKHGDGSVLLRARERALEDKIVVVMDFLPPDFDQSAGGRHTYTYIRLLLNMGYRVKFVAEHLERLDQLVYVQHLRDLGVETLVPPTLGATVDWSFWLNRHKDAIDCLLLNRPSVAVKYGELAKSLHIPTLYFAHDLHFLRENRSEAYEEGTYADSHFKAAQRDAEIDLFRSAGFAYSPSQYEVNLLKSDYHLENVGYLPLFINDGELTPVDKPPKEKSLMFVGGMRHQPNLDGVKWFLEEVLPSITNKVPDATIHFVGGHYPLELRDHGSEQIIFHGRLPDEDLFELYGNVRGIIVPLRYGAGAKGKLVEAMQMGIPVISTSIGLEGVPDKENILKPHDSKIAFAKAAVDLLQKDDAEWLDVSQKLTASANVEFSKETAWSYFSDGLVRIGLEEGEPAS